MKNLLMIACLLAFGCSTTTTTAPDGVKTTTRTVDQAALKAGMQAAQPIINQAVATGIQVGTQAAVQAIQNNQ
jgi:hypothetical protein